jgi:hypothetical protein
MSLKRAVRWLEEEAIASWDHSASFFVLSSFGDSGLTKDSE